MLHRGQPSTVLGTLALLALATACAPATSANGIATAASANANANASASANADNRSIAETAEAQGIHLAAPLDLEPRIRAEATQIIGTWGSPQERLRRLIAFLNDKNHIGFTYESNLSLTATQAYHARRGDCMAYTNLFMALARHLGLPAYYVHVSEVLSHYEHKGLFFTSSHVAVGYGSGPSAVVVDFTKETSDWKLSIYRAIDDATAAALYYNNIAVDAMMAGRLDEAERILKLLIEQKPGIEELYNNLGVLLNRRTRHKEALSVLQEGMRIFPSYKPLYTNGLAAARGAGRADLVKEFEERGQEIVDKNPYFLFARGMGFYQSSKYLLAAAQLERAASAKPDSPVIFAWLARAYLSAGRREEGRQAFAEARRLAPESRILRELESQFPELR